MALLTNTAEAAQTDGTLVDGTNSASGGDAFTHVSNTEIAYQAAAAYKGARGFRHVSAASAASYVGWANVAGASNQAAQRVYFRMAALPAATSRIFTFRSATASTGLAQIQINNAGQVVLGSDAAGANLGSPSAALSLNTWYRIEAGITNGTTTTGTAAVRVYVGDSTTVYTSIDVSAVNLGTATIGANRVGRSLAVASAWTFDFDDVAFQTGSATLIGPAVSPSFSTLTDTYATLDGTKWVYAGNASIVGGRLQLSTSATYQGAKSVRTYNLDVPVPVQVVQAAGPGNNTVDTTFFLRADANNSVSFTREGTLLYAQRMVAGVTTTIAQPTYNATSHAWWRFAVSGGQILWQVSSAGSSWTTLGTPWTPTFPITNLYAELVTGYYGTEPSPGVALFDNFGLPPASNVSPTANAGADQTNVEPWSTVTLTGTDSDSDGTIASRSWAQTGGSPTLTLSGTGATRTFEAPGTIAGTTLTFTYTVTDNAGASGSDTMTVAVLPVTERAVIGGVEVPMRIRTY